jgi:uncharacterized cupin superfamily protein
MPTNERDVSEQVVDRPGANFRRKRLGAADGSEDLGVSLHEVPPGESAWPYHHHTANEEALYVLDGTGVLRLAGEEHRLESGDYAAFPADESGAHAVRNDGEEPLRYLVVSTMVEPEVLVYPDSGKVGALAGAAPGEYDGRTVEAYFRQEDAVDYWDGEGTKEGSAGEGGDGEGGDAEGGGRSG